MVVTQITMAASLKASNDGLNVVDLARRKKGWNKTEKAWAGLATTSQATLRRFWAGLPIRSETFEKICEVVGIIDWTEIIEIDKYSVDEEVDPNGKRLCFAIAGSIDKTDKQKLDAIVALLREMGGDTTIEMVDIDEGSLKIILKGSDLGLHRIKQLFDSGALTVIKGTKVLEVKYLATNELADIIRTNGAEALDLSDADLRGANLSGADLSRADLSRADLSDADLSRADLSDADLSRADLSGADLSRADLSGADLSSADLNRARFGNNLGLSERDKVDMERRGAIFDDSPDSDVPSFILR